MKAAALCLPLLLLVACHRREEPARHALRRVNDRIGSVFTKISDEHRFNGVVPSDWTVDHFSATGERLELGFVDAGKTVHSIALLLAPPDDGKVDGQGTVFFYRYVRGADQAADAQALLKAAGVVDSAITPDVLISVQPPQPEPHPIQAEANPKPPPGPPSIPPPMKNPPGYSEPWEARTISRPTALFLGALQSLIILGAILAAVVIPLRRRETGR